MQAKLSLLLLFTGRKAIFPATAGGGKRGEWLHTTLMCCCDVTQGLRLHLSILLERPGETGWGKQHVNGSGGLERE